jgi:hypothetical protein
MWVILPRLVQQQNILFGRLRQKAKWNDDNDEYGMGLFRPEISINLTGFCVNEAHSRGRTVEFFERHVQFLECVFWVEIIES